MSAKKKPGHGLVMLSAWVEPALREYVRIRAEERGIPVSEWVANALRKQVGAESVARLLPGEAKP